MSDERYEIAVQYSMSGELWFDEPFSLAKYKRVINVRTGQELERTNLNKGLKVLPIKSRSQERRLAIQTRKKK